MAIPTVASVGAVFGGAGSVTSGLPGTPHTAGDIDIILLECADNDTPSLSTASGYARLTALDQTVGSAGAGTQMSVWWRRWNGTDGDAVFADAGDHQIGRMISISGCIATGDPWDITGTGTTDSSADTSVSIAGGTTTVADCLILGLVCQSGPDTNTATEFGSPTNGDLANLTERIDNSRNAGNGGAIYVVSGEKATAGTFGATTLTATSSELRVCGILALKPPTGSQALAGSLFTKAPTFFTGVVTPGAVSLTGTLFAKAPTFFTGAVTQPGGTQTLTGSLFTKTPTFPTGAVTSTYALTGSLFTKAPTFFTGSLQYYTNLLVVELDDGDAPPVDTDHWLRGNVRATAGTGWVRLRLYQGATLIAGFEFEPTGSFATYEYELLEAEAATITDYDNLQIHVDVKAVTHPFTVEVDWVELERPIAVGQTLGGTLFSKTPTFFTGEVTATRALTGTLFAKAPTFPQGVVGLGAGPQTLAGVLFQKAPTFPQGVVGSTYALTGTLFQKAPTFFTGAVTATRTLTGALFQKTPTFFTGTLATAGGLTGVLFTKTPTFFVGVVDLDTTGAFWTYNPAGYTLNPAAYTLNPAAYDPVGPDEIPPWGFEIYGTLFQKAPTFPVGAIS